MTWRARPSPAAPDGTDDCEMPQTYCDGRYRDLTVTERSCQDVQPDGVVFDTWTKRYCYRNGLPSLGYTVCKDHLIPDRLSDGG